MDSTAEEGARDAEQPMLPASAGDVDLISGLDDDVLLRVLGLVPDASDAARAATLSRRWLRLWTRIPALHFASRPASWEARGAERRAAMEEFVSFVNGVLAQRTRSGCAAIEALSISYTSGPSRNREERMQASMDAVQGWIRYAFQHGVKSFMLNLSPNLFEHTVVLDHELHSPVKLESMRLALGGKSLRLPNAMKLASLTELSLEGTKIANGGVHLLCRLVSSASCPHLEKLHMSKLWLDFNEEIRLEADVLSELWVEQVNVMSLQLRTPHLKVLHIDNCYHKVLRVSAPRLEELALFIPLGCPLRSLEVDGDLPCVRTLKLCLWSHFPPDSPDGEAENNDAGMLLLKHCSSVTCLHITIDGRKVSEEDVDLIKSRVPHLPHITSSIVNVSFMLERHDFGVGVASLLTRFNNLRRLSVHLPSFLSLDRNPGALFGLECYHPDYWTSHEISMAHVQEVELTGLTGTDCELWFMKAMLASAAGLCKVAISFNPKCEHHQAKMDAFERMLLNEGMSTYRREAHKLTCYSWAYKM